ncbi:MAG: Poly-beta-1,6-N-acetyl-D-glucosamine synthase [candidate division WS6 bacterium OLB20]|uniref:Poly-beta-1,6-N-acetyl-D-glucosamine synthase n=1 Tax=candidate division WS6 bacterium OLB20 TaxID=1617426 RepID=A0A136LW23_9BACT|nr:MAG: Poly-beta-1,6-N-acetyl-D-glucosamine synthase [candidate division WS6 bacterium OLB20]
MPEIRRPKLTVIMPVWNERKTVETAVRRIHALPVDKEIIVIDDYSTDGSREILKKLQPELRLKLILHAHNKGKGAAFRMVHPTLKESI